MTGRVTDPRELPTRQVGALHFRLAEIDDAVAMVLNHISTRSSPGVSIHFANAYCVALASPRSEYRATMTGADLIFPDGRPVSWVSRLRRDNPPLSQVRGPSFFFNALRRSNELALRHYFIGGSDETRQALMTAIAHQFASVVIAGSESPPFRPLSEAERDAQRQRIVDSGADLVWVGLGTPKQDAEAVRIAREVGVTTLAVGAAFNFMAGTSREAPNWMKWAGLEWMFRLIMEPRRLWRRYFWGNLRFIYAAVSNGR